jgi:hypothetical protein
MSSSARVALVTAMATLVAFAAVPGTADAAGGKRAKATRTKAKPKKQPKKKHKKKTSSRRHRAGKRRASNMPPGWTWPPSKDMVAAGKACTDELDALGIAWKPAKKEKKVATPITLPVMELGGVKLVSVFRRGPFVMDCHLALGLAAYLPSLHDKGVRELHFSRIHGYTNVRVDGGVKPVLSRHALGLAIDVRSFVDDTGRKAVVLDDYPLGDALLLDVEQTLTDAGGFRTILTPRNDPQSHDDHFHLEVRVDFTATPPRKPAT